MSGPAEQVRPGDAGQDRWRRPGPLRRWLREKRPAEGDTERLISYRTSAAAGWHMAREAGAGPEVLTALSREHDWALERLRRLAPEVFRRWEWPREARAAAEQAMAAEPVERIVLHDDGWRSGAEVRVQRYPDGWRWGISLLWGGCGVGAGGRHWLPHRRDRAYGTREAAVAAARRHMVELLREQLGRGSCSPAVRADIERLIRILMGTRQLSLFDRLEEPGA